LAILQCVVLIWINPDRYATYEPVNKLAKDASHDRNGVIARDYPSLRDDLKSLMPNRSISPVLIKANVGRILEPLLLKDGFSVLNGGKVIYFPSHGRQMDLKSSLAPS
jgi:hypothetical protein